ncbi:MAG TPA: hypothetical protein VK666_31110 [Chryseolinea sp.]|nr:hypothetical protein [Chryseolinea sp.]
MKEKVDKLNQNLPKISKEISKMLKEKFGITGLNISQIYFTKEQKCPPGYTRICKYYGNDPVTGQPIIKCKCVKNK